MPVYSDNYAHIMNTPCGENAEYLNVTTGSGCSFSVSEVYLVVRVLRELCYSFCIELWNCDVMGLFRNKCLQFTTLSILVQ